MRLIYLLAACLLAAPAKASLLPSEDGARTLYLDTIQREAAQQGVPAALADAVAMVETGYHVNAVGTSGEIGMMQIMPATARQLGFAGTLAALFQPATNIHLGVAYLARAWAISGGNVCRALMKYRAGLGEEMMSPLSVTYCARAMTWLDATGSNLAQGGPGNTISAAAAPAALAPDPHVVAMFPPLPEQAGLVASAPMPVVVTPTAYYGAAGGTPVQAGYVQHIGPQHPRKHHRAPVDKAAAAVEAALSQE